MNWILGLGATLLGVYLFLQAMSVILTLSRLVRLQFWTIRGEPVTRDEAGPETVVLDSARAVLEQEGFVYQRTSLVDALIASPACPASLCDFYYHAALDVHAEVVTASTPSPQRPCDIILLNGFEDGSALMTVNGIAHHFFTSPSNITIVDPYAQTFQLQMAAHLARRDTIDLVRIAPAAAPGFNAKLAAGMWPAMVSEGRAYKLGERQGKTVYALRLAAALKAAWRMRAGTIQRDLMELGEAPLDAAAQESSPAWRTAERIAFVRALCTLNSMRAPRWFRWSAFVLSAGAFVALGTWWWGITFALVIAMVVAVHEAGHWLAMRLARFSDIQVFFVPGFGGATSGEKHDASPATLLAVFLAGPLPGILVSLGLIGWMLLGGPDTRSWWYAPLAMAAAMTFLVNFLNLLPVAPLDGGRVIELLVMARLPWLRFIFTLASALFLGWSGFTTGDRVLQGFALVLLIAIPHHYRTARLSRALLRSVRDVPMAGEQFSGVAGRLYDTMTQPPFQKWPVESKTTVGWTILPRFLGRLPTAKETAVGLCIYLACLLTPLAILAVLAIKEPDRLGYIVFGGWSERSHRQARAQPPAKAPAAPTADNNAELAKAQAPAERVAVLHRLIEQADDEEDDEEGLRLVRLLYAETGKRASPASDHADASLALATALMYCDCKVEEGEVARLLSESEGISRKLLARPDQQGDPMALARVLERRIELGNVAPLPAWREVVALMAANKQQAHQQLPNARLALARELDRAGQAKEAEQQLAMAAVDANAMRGKNARRQHQLALTTASFLMYHERDGEALALLEPYLAGADKFTPGRPDFQRDAFQYAAILARKKGDWQTVRTHAQATLTNPRPVPEQWYLRLLLASPFPVPSYHVPSALLLVEAERALGNRADADALVKGLLRIYRGRGEGTVRCRFGAQEDAWRKPIQDVLSSIEQRELRCQAIQTTN